MAGGILLVGANGQVGWEVERRAPEAGFACHALGRADLDITQQEAVLRAVDRLAPALAVNVAAYTAVDRAESEIETAFAVNRDGAAYLAEACASADLPLIHLSTDYVFDGRKQTPYREEDAVAPLGVYGRSKLAGEEAVRRSCTKHVILRTSWIYGIHGHNFVKTMLRLGRERETLRVVDDQSGCPTFAGDLARAILTLASRLKSQAWPDSVFGTFHCAGEGATTWFDFARVIFKEASPMLRQVPRIEAIKTADYPTPAKRPPYSVLDCSRLAEVHGIVLRPWRVSLAEMLDAAAGQLPAGAEVRPRKAL